MAKMGSPHPNFGLTEIATIEKHCREEIIEIIVRISQKSELSVYVLTRLCISKLSRGNIRNRPKSSEILDTT